MLTASIVTYHTSPEELNTCLCCVQNSAIVLVYVVDNSNMSYIREICNEYPKAKYIANKNIGYGAGHNIAIRLCIERASKYHLVLNSDIEFTSEAIDGLMRYMEQYEDVAQVQPRILSPDGSDQYTCRLLPTPRDLIFRRFLPKSIVQHNDYRYALKFADRTRPINAPYHQGSFMMFRTKCLLEVGMFDERFFMYPEDIDITRRMHRLYRTMYYPKVKIVHAHRAASYHNMKMLWIHVMNMIRYFNKWGWLFDDERKRWNRELLQLLHYTSNRSK